MERLGEGNRCMIKVYNQNLEPLAILDNAFDVSVERRVNEVWQVSFSLPINDIKNEECTHFNYIEVIGPSGRNYGKYRIMPSNTSKQGNTIRYECEHVLATLLDDVIDGYEQFTNWTTRQVLEYLLSLQETERWVLDRCDFTRYFHYAFENENGLLAPILSIPQPFDEPFEFQFDTTTFPWKLSLIRPFDEVKAEIRWGKDMTSFDEVSDPSEIVNYLIPKGYGEGVNQLTIKDVNGGLNYLKDQASIDKWGKKSYIWIDRRFTNAETLKAAGDSLLKQWKDPKISFTCGTADLSILPEYAHEQRTLNGVTRIIVEDKIYEARIIGERISDLSKEYEVSYEVNNKLDDIATIQTDVERKQRVNDAYSQGATNIFTESQAENADENNPVEFRLYIPPDLVNINSMEMTYETTRFRGYVKQLADAGQVIQQNTTEGGGSYVQGGTAQSTSTAAGGNHNHDLFIYNGEIPSSGVTNQQFRAKAKALGEVILNLEAPSADITTYTASGDHTHDVSVDIPGFSIPDHSHPFEISIDPHTHPIEWGIFTSSESPNSLEIEVDGITIPQTSLNGSDVDLAPYLLKDSGGRIQRGRYADIKIRPIGGLARINATIVTRLFINSHIGSVL